MSLEQIAARCDKVRWQGKDTFTACCVAHDDRNPSMSVSERDGKILVHCFSGCPQDHLLDALGMTKRDDWKPVERPSKPRKVHDTSATEAKAKRAIELATPCPDNHAYLVEKRTLPYGIGVLGELYEDLPSPVRHRGNVAVIGMTNVHGEILSCQFIAEDGSKAYMAGPKRKGGFYTIQGKGNRVWICEGFATGASLHQDTGESVLVAFDSGGLEPVTAAGTALYGTRQEFIIMADDDWKTKGNPGFTAARNAAQPHGIRALRPVFDGLPRGDKDTDYNDMVRLRDAG